MRKRLSKLYLTTLAAWLKINTKEPQVPFNHHKNHLQSWCEILEQVHEHNYIGLVISANYSHREKEIKRRIEWAGLYSGNIRMSRVVSYLCHLRVWYTTSACFR